MQNNKPLLLRAVVVALVISGCIGNVAKAESQNTSNTASDLTLRRLENIQAETVIYEAQVARAKARKELENNGTDISTRIPSGRDGVDVSVTSSSTSPTRSLPRIQEIYGSPKNLMVSLAMPDGSAIAASDGQLIPGTGWRVKSITGRSVSVTDGTEERQLTFQ